MLILKSIIFENIGRFTEPQIIDFTQLGSLVQVDAENRNTGGSSGAGKSTIFKALDFLLGLSDVSTTVLQSRLTKSSISVTGIFELDGVPLKIERGKKLLIDLNGEITTGSSKLAEEKLDEIIGMDRELFRKILHKRQGEGGFFLDLGPSETHKFLTNCLGLQKEQAKILTLDTRLSVLETDRISIQSAVESYRSALQASESAISSLGPSPTLEIGPEAIEALSNKHVEAQENHKLLKLIHKKEMDDFELTRPKIVTTPFDRSDIERSESEIQAILTEISGFEKLELDRQSNVKSKISELQVRIADSNSKELKRQSEVKEKISTFKLQIAKFEEQEKNRQSEVRAQVSANKVAQIQAQATIKEGDRAKNEAGLLAKELEKIRASICPTCEQGWITDAAKAKETGILTKLQEHKKAVVAGMQAAKKLAELTEEQKELEQNLIPRPSLEVHGLSEQIKFLSIDAVPVFNVEVQQLNKEIEVLKEEARPQAIKEAMESKMKIDAHNQTLVILRKKEKDHQLNENIRQQAIRADWDREQIKLMEKQAPLIKFVQDEENLAFNELEKAKAKVWSFEEAKKRYEESLNKLKAQSDSYRKEFDKNNEKLNSVLEEIEIANEAKKAIKSYLSCSFEDALDSIGDTATRFIRGIPNMQNATIQFEGLKETKEGKIKEEVVCTLSMDGEIGIPIKSLSGGERSSTDLAIDLSVIKFIEERTGKGIDLFVLDEPFTGLDSQNILEALEMLKECSSDKRLLIVDHNPIAAQTIENKITVIRDGLTSKVMQQ